MHCVKQLPAWEPNLQSPQTLAQTHHPARSSGLRIRNRIGRCFNRRKHFHHFATRDGRRTIHVEGFVYLDAAYDLATMNVDPSWLLEADGDIGRRKVAELGSSIEPKPATRNRYLLTVSGCWTGTKTLAC